MIWNNKEATTHQGALYLSSHAGLIVERKELLEIMDHFVPPLQERLRQAACLDLNHGAAVQQLMVIRVSHMLASDDIVDYLGPIWEGNSNNRAHAARERIVSWANRQPEDFRMFTFSCAQMLAITRQYLYNHPQEAHMAFHGGMAAWVMSSLYLWIGLSFDWHDETTTTPLPVCNLDWLGPVDAPEALVVQDWIRSGSPCIVRMHGVPNFFSPLGPKQVLQQTAEVLGKMSVWGIAKTLLNATLRVLNA
jgi:hypothetical protein